MIPPIPPYRYEQLHDYLTQIIGLSGTNGLPAIHRTTIANQLKVGSPSICSFINRKTQKPIQIIQSFRSKYPLEIERWPIEKTTIERTLNVADALCFLVIPLKPVLTKALIPARINPLRIPAPPTYKIIDRRRMTLAPIVISYRGHQSIKDGEGMVFDHMRIQHITAFETVTLMPQDQNDVDKASSCFAAALKQRTFNLPYGVPNADSKITPPTTQNCNHLGLLVIPGRARKIENEPIRLSHEYRVIREALNRGQPMIGICAGAWRLYEQMHIWTKKPFALNTSTTILSNYRTANKTLVDVVDHNCGGGMIRLASESSKANYNVQIHDVTIIESSLLKTALLLKKAEKIINNQMSVNSVHWKAVNEARLPENTSICARAIHSPTAKPKLTRESVLMQPEIGSVEAFESCLGAPILGIQWHPEGYNGESPHRNLLIYMALAGSAYAAKRQTLEQLSFHRHGMKWPEDRGSIISFSVTK